MGGSRLRPVGVVVRVPARPVVSTRSEDEVWPLLARLRRHLDGAALEKEQGRGHQEPRAAGRGHRRVATRCIDDCGARREPPGSWCATARRGGDHWHREGAVRSRGGTAAARSGRGSAAARAGRRTGAHRALPRRRHHARKRAATEFGGDLGTLLPGDAELAAAEAAGSLSSDESLSVLTTLEDAYG